MSTARPSSSRQVHYILLKAHLNIVTPTGSHIREPDGLCGTYDSHLMKVSRTFRTLVLGIFKGFFFSTDIASTFTGMVLALCTKFFILLGTCFSLQHDKNSL